MTELVPEPAAVAKPARFTVRPSFANHLSLALERALSLVNSLLIAILLVVAVEWIARGTLQGVGTFMTSMARPGFTTVGAVLLAMLAIDAIFSRAYQSVFIVAPPLVILAFINSQKQLYLSDPLYPTDMLFGRQIMQLLPAMAEASPVLAMSLAIGLIVAAIALVCLWRVAWRRFPRLSLTARVSRLAVALPLLIAFGSLMEYSQYSWVRDRLRVIPKMWDQKENYRHNGLLLAFAFNLPMANITTPAGYGAASIADIPASNAAFAYKDSDKPDVIMLMSESLWDPMRLHNVRISPDPMPTIRASQSGNVFSPEFGGMTANVEFEALTGFSNAFLPYGSIPYQQYIRQPLPSLATFFRSEGYSAIAMHPFQGWFWNRSEVYRAFGFEEFRSEETLPPLQKRGKFASDESLTEEIIRQADAADKPLFLFAVTLQGHGPYEPNRYANDRISVNGKLSPAAQSALTTYAEGVNEADKSLAMLMDWARKRKRETIIVLFGDHLPPMATVYRETGYMPGAVATRRAPLDVMKKEHETPLLIWSSKTGVRKDVGTISPSLLPYHVLKMTGFEDPFYTGILGDVQATFPVVDRYMLVTAEGEGRPAWAEKPANIDPLIQQYRLLQHDMMFGAQHGRDRFFPSFQLLTAGQS